MFPRNNLDSQALSSRSCSVRTQPGFSSYGLGSGLVFSSKCNAIRDPQRQPSRPEFPALSSLSPRSYPLTTDERHSPMPNPLTRHFAHPPWPCFADSTPKNGSPLQIGSALVKIGFTDEKCFLGKEPMGLRGRW